MSDKIQAVLITGTTKGIGKQTALMFLKHGFFVIGIDILSSSIRRKNYMHFIADVGKPETLPDLGKYEIIYVVNNAGVQNGNDIEVNLLGTVNVTEKYAIQPHIRSIVNVASASAHTGAEFPLYSASKGGVLAYTKNVALRVAEYGATCNSVSPGGVHTELNHSVVEDTEKWNKIMELTPLKKWASADEIAEWIYFLAVVNKSMTGRDVLIDNGESEAATFIW